MSILKKALNEKPDPFDPRRWLDCSEDGRMILVRRDYATERELEIGKEIEDDC